MLMSEMKKNYSENLLLRLDNEWIHAYNSKLDFMCNE